MRRPRSVLFGFVSIAVASSPHALAAQWPTFEARIGVAWHGSAPCHDLERHRGLALGIEARTPGAWIASGALDLMLDDWSWSCLDVGRPEFEYGGQVVSLVGSSGAGVRLKVSVGRTLTIGAFRSTITTGAGLFPTYTDYEHRGEFSWQPWYGGTLTLRIPDFGTGVQLELGRHRMTQRHYTVDTDILVDEVQYWERFVRLGLSFPL